MRLVFWQNCLSPHQLPYIVHISDMGGQVDEVVIVAGETVSGERKSMGWSLGKYPGLDKCKVYVKPHECIVESLLAERTSDTWHLFSGIRADAFVFSCLERSMKYDLHRGMIVERPNTYDFKRNIRNAKPYWLHRIRFWLKDRKYAKKMEVVFAMGMEAVEYYQSLGMKWKVLPFMYCTQAREGESLPVGQTGETKILFVGSLSYWKSPQVISCSVAACMKADSNFLCHVTYVGDGMCRADMEKYVAAHHLEKQVTFAGFQPIADVPQWMQKNDVLILPSLYDGWGAVVNEALQAGCFVICSDACGASMLLEEDAKLGLVFHAGDVKLLTKHIKYCGEHIAEIRSNRAYRQDWAEEHISGKVVAKYMVDALKENL